MEDLHMRELIGNPDDWYEAWENTPLDESKDFLLATIREDLPDDFDETTDFNGVVLEWVGEVYEKQRDFITALEFLEEYAEKQPVLYADSAAYFAAYYLNFYFFTGEFEKVKAQYEFFLANPCDKVEETLEFHNKLWYWGRHEWALGLARSSYKPVFESPDIFDWVARELALPVLYDALQKAREQYEATGRVDFSEAEEVTKEFGFTIEKKVWKDFEHLFTAAPDDKLLLEEMLNPSPENSHKLVTLFQLYMHRRGMHFHTASMIINDLYNFWKKEANKKRLPAERFFRLEKNAFERHLGSHKKLFFINTTEAYKSLWGAMYVYDFLLSRQLVPQAVYDEALQTIRSLKSIVCKSGKHVLWTVGFIPKAWQKPDGMSTEEFEQEAALFERSFREPFEPDEETEPELDFKKAVNLLFEADKKVPAYEKKPRPPRNPANKASRKKKRKKKK